MGNNALVSIVLLTYNQSNLVLETLDSIYRQTYRNIELIISDDCSKDNTIEVCKEWINEHKSRFVGAQIITTTENTGISGNINRGVAKAKGKWVEKVDADDIMELDAVQNYVNYMTSHPEVIYVFAKMKPFGDNQSICDEFEEKILQYDFFACTAQEQYKRLMLNQVYVPAPTCFFELERSQQLGIKCDESIPMIDDWPRWIKLTKSGHKLYFMDKMTMNYRIYGKSMSSGRFGSPFQKSQMLFYIKYQFWYNFIRHPRSSWIKYVMYQKYLTNQSKWSIIESLGRKTSMLYCAFRHSNVNDWDKMENAITNN